MCPGVSLHVLGNTPRETAGAGLKSPGASPGRQGGATGGATPRGLADIWAYLQARFLTSLKGIFDVIHFHLGSRHPEDSFML